MPAMRIRANWWNIRALGLRGPAVAALTSDTADRVARRAAAQVGWHVLPGGAGWTKGSTIDKDGVMRREDDPTGERERSAILAQHPNQARRAAGRQALQAAL